MNETKKVKMTGKAYTTPKAITILVVNWKLVSSEDEDEVHWEIVISSSKTAHYLNKFKFQSYINRLAKQMF